MLIFLGMLTQFHSFHNHKLGIRYIRSHFLQDNSKWVAYIRTYPEKHRLYSVATNLVWKTLKTNNKYFVFTVYCYLIPLVPEFQDDKTDLLTENG